MASRRSGGGMGGPQRGNRSFSQHQPFQGNNVSPSPWQGNVPSNNSMNQGLISQLTSNPQQLALALSSLFQPQQQQINNPPSLLSLNTTPAFSNQDNDLNRFGRGRDFRRHEPYNKSRNGGGGWRPMDNNRNRNRNRDRRSSKDRSRDRKDNRRNDKPSNNDRKDSEQEHNIKPEPKTEENRDEEVHEETKRDWKDEKNLPDVKKEEKSDDPDNQDDDKEKKHNDSDRQGKYFDVPVKFLHCFVCNKEMWDGESMQKHIRGRAHKQMLNTLEESIAITVNILRENMRLAEEKKVIEWNRMHRLKKFNKYNEPQSHCNMCDLKFLGKIITHRKTETHQRLKRYLHPTCNICNKEFPARIEWIEHRLTPEHLRKLNDSLEAKEGGADGAALVQEEELDLEPLLEESLQMESENPVLELDDDLTGLQNLIPAYNPNRPVSTKSLTSFTGFLCELCNRSFDKEELAQAHLKTKRHYYAFIGAAKAKLQKQNDEAKKAEETVKEENNDVKEESQNGEQANDDLYDPEEACNDEENSVENEQENNVKQDEEPAEEEVQNATEAKEETNENEEEKTPETPTRAKRRAAAAAGPKIKKLATPSANEQTQAKPPNAPVISSNFRIPKTGGAVRGGACPKSKKPQTK